MTQSDDQFLKDLQTQCLKECDDYFANFQEGLTQLASHPIEALSQMMKACHSLKGNLQAVGFVPCGELVHALESAISSAENLIKERTDNLIDGDSQILEFFLSDAINCVMAYCKELSTTFKDDPKIKAARIQPIAMVTNWKPSDYVKKTGAAKTPKLRPKVNKEQASAPIEAVPTEAVSNTIEVSSENAACPTALASATSDKPTEKSSEKTPEKVPQKLYLLCQNGNRYVGISINHVVKIARRETFLNTPYSGPGYLGLMSVQGHVIPIMNLRTAIGDEAQAKYVVVCKDHDRQYGFLVEYADKVIELNSGDFQEATAMHVGNTQKVISNFCNFEKKTVMIVDLDRALKAA